MLGRISHTLKAAAIAWQTYAPQIDVVNKSTLIKLRTDNVIETLDGGTYDIVQRVSQHLPRAETDKLVAVLLICIENMPMKSQIDVMNHVCMHNTNAVLSPATQEWVLRAEPYMEKWAQ